MEDLINPKMLLKPFLESIKHACKNMSKEDLIDFILFYAENLHAKDRVVFLDHIYSFSNSEFLPEIDKNIFDEIQDLKDEVKERIESIEDGSYYGNYDNYDNYNDSEPDYLSEGQKEQIKRYFREADKLFIAKKLEQAKNIYRELYSFFSNEQDLYGINEFDVNIEHRETRARYCRCVYETEKSSIRVEKFLQAININAPLSDLEFNIYDNIYPLFSDVKNTSLKELKNEDAFLEEWIEVLKNYDSKRAHVLLLEAVHLKKGLNGVLNLARKWKSKEPRGYLYWLNIKKEEKDWNEIVKIAKESLSELPLNELRGVIAEELLNAGKEINNDDIILQGNREFFYSVPDEKSLISLIQEAKKQEVKNIELDKVISFLEKKEDTKCLKIKALLMRGELQKSFEIAKNIDTLGWSYSNEAGGVLFAAILTTLVKKDIENSEIIKLILKRYTLTSYKYSFSTDYDEVDKALLQEIIIGLKDIKLSQQEIQKYIGWAENIGRKRIEAIVSNKHRKSYVKAAEILGGLSECFIILGHNQKGINLIIEYRDDKYNRYPAFKSELYEVLSTSKII